MTDPQQTALKNANAQAQVTQASATQAATESLVPEQPVANQAVLEQAQAAPAAAQQHSHRHVNRGPGGIQSLLTVIVFTVFVIGNGGAQRPILPYRGIQRGDIIVFFYPVDPSQFVVKRVIGLPGDHVRLQNKVVYLNGAPLQENYAIHTGRNYDGYRDNFPLQTDHTGNVDRRWRSESPRHVDHGELVVPADAYFVLGDNREQSADSRYWGFVPRANIVGRPLMIYLSVKGEAEADSSSSSSNDKLFHSGQMLAHLLQLARWDRTFHLVR